MGDGKIATFCRDLIYTRQYFCILFSFLAHFIPREKLNSNGTADTTPSANIDNNLLENQQQPWRDAEMGKPNDKDSKYNVAHDLYSKFELVRSTTVEIKNQSSSVH